jgi:hypothetical protein
MVDIYMKLEEIEQYNPITDDSLKSFGQNIGFLIIKTADTGGKPDYFDKSYDKRIIKKFILWYKRNQLLKLDEELKNKNVSSLKKISSFLGLTKSPNKEKIKEKIMGKNWKSIDKIYEKIKNF